MRATSLDLSDAIADLPSADRMLAESQIERAQVAVDEATESNGSVSDLIKAHLNLALARGRFAAADQHATGGRSVVAIEIFLDGNQQLVGVVALDISVVRSRASTRSSIPTS